MSLNDRVLFKILKKPVKTMKAKQRDEHQQDFLMTDLSSLLNSRHPLYQLSHKLSWGDFESVFSKHYSAHDGAPGKSIRLMVSLLLLKQLYDLSDEAVVVGTKSLLSILQW